MTKMDTNGKNILLILCSVKKIHCVTILSLLFFSFILQSKEIAFQLQEDLMKVLNELYTVSINDLLCFH